MSGRGPISMDVGIKTQLTLIGIMLVVLVIIGAVVYSFASERAFVLYFIVAVAIFGFGSMFIAGAEY